MKTGKLKRSFTPQDSISKKGYFIIAVCSFLLVFLVWLLLTELGLVNENSCQSPLKPCRPASGSLRRTAFCRTSALRHIVCCWDF